MNDDQRKIIAGGGSYVALIVMVWFTMAGAPAWLTLIVSIANGWLFTFLMSNIMVPFFVNGYHVLMLLHEIHNGPREELNVEVLDILMAYCYEQAKLSDLQKGVS